VSYAPAMGDQNALIAHPLPKRLSEKEVGICGEMQSAGPLDSRMPAGCTSRHTGRRNFASGTFQNTAEITRVVPFLSCTKQPGSRVGGRSRRIASAPLHFSEYSRRAVRSCSRRSASSPDARSPTLVPRFLNRGNFLIAGQPTHTPL